MQANLRTQSGLTLIELMIALVISLVLVGGISTVYISSKRNYQTRDQLSMMDESARVALTLLTQHLEHAGYATASKLPIGNYFYVKGAADPVTGICDNLQGDSLNAIKAGATTDNALTNADLVNRDTDNSYGDAISIRFLGDSALNRDVLNEALDQNCWAGAVPLENSLIYNTFYIDKDQDVKDSLGKYIPILYAAGSNGKISKRPLVNGIQNLQLMYGVDANEDGLIDKYVSATDMAVAEWSSVTSIKVGILVRSLEPILDKDTPQTYTVLDKSMTFTDRYTRSVYGTVIQLRNAVEG